MHTHPRNPLVLEDDWFDEFLEAEAREEALASLRHSHPLEGERPSTTVVRPGPVGTFLSPTRGAAASSTVPAGTDDP